MKDTERTIEEKYELAKKVLMLVERAALAHMVGLIPEEHAANSLRVIANMAHVANHENGENTFDCGPNRKEHHARAMQDYDEMYNVMLADIRAGHDVCTLVNKSIATGIKATTKTGGPEIDDEDFAQPIDLS